MTTTEIVILVSASVVAVVLCVMSGWQGWP